MAAPDPRSPADNSRSGRTNVHILASMPAGKLREFLQNLRDFDARHNFEIPFEVVASSPTLSTDEIKGIFASIRPPVPFSGTVNLNPA